MKDIVGILAILAAGVWAVYTFSRDVAEDARREKPVWSPKLKLEKIGQQHPKVAIRATVLLENKGSARQNFWAGTLNVFGWRVQTVGDGGVANHIDIPDAHINWREFWGFKEQEKILIASYGLSVLPPMNAFVDPGDSYERNYIFYVDRQQFDLVEAQIRLLVPEKSVEVQDASWIVHTKDSGTNELNSALDCEGDSKSRDLCSYTTGASIQMSLWEDEKEPKVKELDTSK